MKGAIKIKKAKFAGIVWAVGVTICAIIAMLYYFGVIQLNNPSYTDYPVRGVDVSNYQGEIDWDILSEQNIKFAFIKATEGSSFVDARFKTNYENAQKTQLRVGAYHFFSFQSQGITQAENFIETVPKIENMLPPVVDFEFYGGLEKKPPEKTETREQLNIMLSELEAYYGMKPIIYVKKEAYDTYLQDGYEEYDIWIRSVYNMQIDLGDCDWVFWQYSNRMHLKGYDGKEYYIDMNAFYGTEEEFQKYPQ